MIRILTGNIDFVVVIFILGLSCGVSSPQKSFQHRFEGDKENEEFFKTLEYAANHKDGIGLLPNSQLSTIDLNLISEDEFAWEIADGVDEGLTPFDEGIDQSPPGGGVRKDNAAVGGKEPPSKQKKKDIQGEIPRMHIGIYTQDPEWNLFVDSLSEDIIKQIGRKRLDPIYFTVHKRGVVRHAPKGHRTMDGELVDNDGSLADLSGRRNRSGILGAGHIGGLKMIRRFGNTESREENGKLLIRSHYFFGPLEMELVFRVKNGLREINSTLSSLAAHALHEVDPVNKDEATLLEFILDSPLEYEVELRGSRNKRLRRLSQAAALRLFKRAGRIERRLRGCYRRATEKRFRKAREDMSGHKVENSNTKPIL